MNDAKIGLTVFLVKPDQVAALEKELLGPDQIQIALREPLEGIFAPMLSSEDEPPWVQSIRSITQNPLPADMNSKSPSGLLVVKRPGGTFVLAFGHAWMKLEDSWLERDFGRRVALNAIAKDKLIEIKAEQVFAKFHLASERAPRASSVDEFGVEFDRDLVAAVEGEPSAKSSLGKTIRGATSLRLKSPISKLQAVLDESIDLFGSDAYKKDWPEIDNISPVKTQAIGENLEKQLDTDLASGKAKSRMALFTPSQRGEESVCADSYVYGRLSKSPATRTYLTYEGWLSFLAQKKANPSVVEAKASPVHILDGAGVAIKKYSVFDCFGYEVSLDGKVFILSSGIWYEVEADFVGRINDIINSIPDNAPKLPTWHESEAEAAYNARCGEVPPFLNCDTKKIFYGGQQSQFEFCDLVHLPGRTLFFAKIVSRSSGMSHLVEQVRRTTQLLFGTDDTYRKKAAALFKKYRHKADVSWLKSRPRQGDWTLCMVSLGKPATKLPFFAKCTLVKVYKELREQGHAVSFVKV
jgi:uncharacterized protein (TIGR04141 family)